MMKKMVSMAMAAVMAATLMVAAVPAEVKAAEAGSTDVSYTKSVTDENNPSVYISIPDSIKFTDTTKSVDANVELVDENGNIITAYNGTAIFSVTSANGFKLASNGNVLPYTLTYGENALSSTTTNPLAAQNIGTIGTVEGTLDATLEGTATLPEASVATVAGTYTDTLTYSVTFDAE